MAIQVGVLAAWIALLDSVVSIINKIRNKSEVKLQEKREAKK